MIKFFKRTRSVSLKITKTQRRIRPKRYTRVDSDTDPLLCLPLIDRSKFTSKRQSTAASSTDFAQSTLQRLARCPVDLHSISMTTRSRRSSLLLAVFSSRARARDLRGMIRGWTTSEKKKRREGWPAVRQYFLSSHGQLADRFTRLLLAQHTNLASESWLAIVNACVFTCTGC